MLFLKGALGNAGHLGATLPGPHIHDWQAMLIELVLTLGLVSTILGTASRAQNVGPLSAVGVGGYIALAGLWSSPISGASMNPARSFGPALVPRRLQPLLALPRRTAGGSALAVAFAWILRGRGGDSGGVAAARGTLGPPRARGSGCRASTSLGAIRRVSKGARLDPAVSPWGADTRSRSPAVCRLRSR